MFVPIGLPDGLVGADPVVTPCAELGSGLDEFAVPADPTALPLLATCANALAAPTIAANSTIDAAQDILIVDVLAMGKLLYPATTAPACRFRNGTFSPDGN